MDQLDQLDQVGLTQEIVDRALSGIEPGWREFIIDYCVEGIQSNFSASYVIEEAGVVTEKPLPIARDMDKWFRKLRDHLAQAGRPPFSRCKLQLSDDGRFETTYGYDPIDWEAQIYADWNFFPKNGKREPV